MIGVHVGYDDGVNPLVLDCQLKFSDRTGTDVEQNGGV
jgi:hypothetical protein